MYEPKEGGAQASTPRQSSGQSSGQNFRPRDLDDDVPF
jgi:hypothetical protein